MVSMENAFARYTAFLSQELYSNENYQKIAP